MLGSASVGHAQSRFSHTRLVGPVPFVGTRTHRNVGIRTHRNVKCTGRGKGLLRSQASCLACCVSFPPYRKWRGDLCFGMPSVQHTGGSQPGHGGPDTRLYVRHGALTHAYTSPPGSLLFRRLGRFVSACCLCAGRNVARVQAAQPARHGASVHNASRCRQPPGSSPIRVVQRRRIHGPGEPVL